MFTESADIYDLLYSFKDYRKESEEIISTIKAKRPDCRAILDIGCGTAEHHKYLKDEFLIDGLDISEEFIKSAKTKNPGGSYHLADMTDFSLDKKYDVITCLFSSIGYVKTYARLASALRCFDRHLKDGGLAIVEPWFTPESWYDGKLHMLTCDEDDIKICRMNRSETAGKLSILNFHYLLGRPGEGVRHFEERHELAMFSKEEMMLAFEDAGFEVIHDAHGLIGRGMYYGTKENAA
jgi:SAM-dependent methyltransferase